MKINIIKKLIMKSKKDPSKELKKKEAAAMFKKSLKEIEDDRKDYLKRVEEFKQGKRKYISDTID